MGGNHMKTKLMCLVIFLLLSTSCTSKNYVASDPLQQALLKENWKQCLVIVDKDYKTSASVEYRAIKGHVFLANNRNNESMEMFLSLNNEKDKKAWLQWSDSFRNKYPKSPVALYLYGDALARNGNNAQAVQIYETAEKSAEQKLTKAMILNASGVAYLSNNNPDKAQGMFEQATQIEPCFGDAHASLGMLLSSSKLYPGAVAEFAKALDISKDFNLATYGRACAMITTCTDRNTLNSIIADLDKINNIHVKLFADELFIQIMETMNSSVNKNNKKGNEGTSVLAKVGNYDGVKYAQVKDLPKSDKLNWFTHLSPKYQIEARQDMIMGIKTTDRNMQQSAMAGDVTTKYSTKIPKVAGIEQSVTYKNDKAYDYNQRWNDTYKNDVSMANTVMNNSIKNNQGGLTTVGINIKFFDFSTIKYKCAYGLSVM
jgi:tetratricopeptide (TPR) repeat protein